MFDERTTATPASGTRRTSRALLIERQAALVPFLREALELANHDHVVTSRCASSRTLARLRPDAVLIGPGGGTRHPFVTIRRLRRELPAARIVVIAYRSDPAWRALAVALGADAVLGPNDDGNVLARALGSTPEREETTRLRRTT